MYLLLQGQTEQKFRAGFQIAGLHRAAVGPDDGQAHGQPQAHVAFAVSGGGLAVLQLSLIHISEPTRLA